MFANKHKHTISFTDLERSYSEQYNVSLRMARLELKSSDEAAAIASMLELEDSKFGGMYIETDPKFKIVFNVKRTKHCNKKSNVHADKCNKRFTKKIKKLINKKKLNRYVKIRKVSFSLADINLLKSKALELAREYAVDGYTLPSSVITGKVELRVVNLYDFENRIYNAGVDLPKELVLTGIDKSNLPKSQSVGGLPIGIQGLVTLCTTGFVTQNSSGVRGITTADHCVINPVTYDGALINQGFVDLGTPEARLPSQDIKWFALPAAQVAASSNRIISDLTASGAPIFTTITGISGAYKAQYVCKYGSTTGKTCGKVVEVNYSYTDSEGTQITNSVLITKDGTPNGGTLSDSGDSGGPYFVNGKAIGTHIGGDDFSSTFSPITNVRAMGTRVLIQ